MYLKVKVILNYKVISALVIKQTGKFKESLLQVYNNLI